MRLTQQQRHLIRKCVAICDPAADVLLFGSRLHNQRRGGDIDLLIRSSKIDFKARLRLKLALMDALGPQKIDIAVDNGRPSAFVKLVSRQARAI
jgi:predicted nucleotidyltransferase